MVGLFCRIFSLFKGSFAEETYNFKETTNRSQPIGSTYGTGVEVLLYHTDSSVKIAGLFCRIMFLT